LETRGRRRGYGERPVANAEICAAPASAANRNAARNALPMA